MCCQYGRALLLAPSVSWRLCVVLWLAWVPCSRGSGVIRPLQRVMYPLSVRDGRLLCVARGGDLHTIDLLSFEPAASQVR